MAPFLEYFRSMKRQICDRCGHSSAAHVDRMHCALCDCHLGEQTQSAQEMLPFRDSLVVRRPLRKRGA